MIKITSYLPCNIINAKATPCCQEPIMNIQTIHHVNIVEKVSNAKWSLQAISDDTMKFLMPVEFWTCARAENNAQPTCRKNSTNALFFGLHH